MLNRKEGAWRVLCDFECTLIRLGFMDWDNDWPVEHMSRYMCMYGYGDGSLKEA